MPYIAITHLYIKLSTKGYVYLFFFFKIKKPRKKRRENNIMPSLHMNWEAKILKNPNLAAPCCGHNHQTPSWPSLHLNCSIGYLNWVQTDRITPSWRQFLLWPGGTNRSLILAMFIGLCQWSCLVSD